MATLIVDAGPLICASDRRDPRNATMRAYLANPRERCVTTPAIVSEVDHLLTVMFGPETALAFLEDLADGAIEVEPTPQPLYREIASLHRRYAGFRPGLSDLSLVVLAQQLDCRRVLTTDQRHFRTMRPLQGGTFTLLPWDEDLP